MNKTLLTTLSILALTAVSASAQDALNAVTMSQQDLKGTARFMSMGGAFGALGGDLSTLSQNPAGIGVYRRNDIGFTLNLDCQRATADDFGYKTTQDQTKFLLNNIGAVFTYRIDSDACPNINFGFTYNKSASFNRHVRGSIGSLQTSMTNYIAGVTQNDECTVPDLTTENNYDPYNPNDGGFAPAWISILGYDSYLISPEGTPDNPTWQGQFGRGTSGFGSFDYLEKGSIDEYNISLGGNIADVVYWGMDFDIIDMNYRLESLWGESLKGAYVNGSNGNTASDWDLYNYYKVDGVGFNYKFGLIVKPIQEFRMGLAIHTPTWYHLTQDFYANTTYSYAPNPGIGEGDVARGGQETNGGYTATNSFKYKAPWRFIASAALVLPHFILSADYEWTSNRSMKYSYTDSYYDYDYGYDDWDDWYWKPAATRSLDKNDPYYYTNSDIKEYTQNTSTLRVGAEFRVTPQFSVRAGYCYSSSPVKQKVRDNGMTVYTAGTRPEYILQNSTNYVTCGLGYKYKKFYVDMAYVWKHRTGEYHAFTPDPTSSIQSPQSKLSMNNSQVVLTAGFKF